MILNPYKVLGVPNNADMSVVKKAYRSLSKKYHPDVKGGDRDKFEEVQKAFSMIESGEVTIGIQQRHLHHVTVFTFA